MKLFKLTLAIAIGAIFINAKTGYAAWTNEFRSDEVSMNWSTAADWQRRDDASGWLEANVEPISGAVVTVRDNHTVAVTTTTNAISSLTIENFDDAILSMEASGVLEINDTLTISSSALFRFYADDGQTRPILRATDTLEIDGRIQVVDPADSDGGAGGVIAQTSTNTVCFNIDSRVTSDEGPIDITAKFQNDGIIEANGANVFISGELMEDSVGMFRISADHTMTFTDGSEVIGGNPSDAHFDVQDGTMLFSGTQTTNFGFRQTGGKVQVGATETFSASGTFDADAGKS